MLVNSSKPLPTVHYFHPLAPEDETRLSIYDKSVFGLVHRSKDSVFTIPLHRLRHLLIERGEINWDGSVNPFGFFRQQLAVPISNLAVECILGCTLTVNGSSFTLKEFIQHYLSLFPNHHVHWIGSSLPLGKQWPTQFLKRFDIDEALKEALEDSLDFMSDEFPDIDIRFMIPHGSVDLDYVQLALEDLCKSKIETHPFSPDEKTKIFTMKKGLGDQFDIDLIQCSHVVPPFNTTLDTAFLLLNNYFNFGDTTPLFMGGVSAGEYFLHRCAKIFYILDPKMINAGTFKRIIQWQTSSYLTPQPRVVDQTLRMFQATKGGRKQFLAVFQERQRHLSPCPKNSLAYCLNLISCIEEHYDIGYKVDYWKQCAELINLPKKGLSRLIAEFIKNNYHGCGYLVTLLKACCLMTYATKKLMTSTSQTLLDVYPGVQNGLPYFVMPINTHSSVHLKLEAEKSMRDLLNVFEITSEMTRKALVTILLEFMKRVFTARFERGDKAVHDFFAELNIDPANIQNQFSGQEITQEPAIHALNIFWKGLIHTLCPMNLEDEMDCVRSLAPALTLFKENKMQHQFIEFIESYTRSELIQNILTRLKKVSRLNITTIFSVIFDLLGQADVKQCEMGYQIWTDAISHSKYQMESRCKGLLNLLLPSYDSRKTVQDKRLHSMLLEKKVSPIILTQLLFEYERPALAQEAFKYCCAEDARQFPRCLIPINRFQNFPLPLWQKLISMLIAQGFFEQAQSDLQKIDLSAIFEDEKKSMTKAATAVVNHWISTKQINKAVNIYQIFIRKGLLNKETSRQWNFLAKACSKIHNSKDISDDLVNKLIELLRNPIALSPKKAKQIQAILTRVLPMLEWSNKLIVLSVFYQWCQTTQNKNLTSFHERKFKEMLSSCDDEKKLALVQTYTEHGHWPFAARALIAISMGSRKTALTLALKILDHLRHLKEFDLMWKILFLYQTLIDDSALEKILITLCTKSRSCPEFPKLNVNLLRRISTMSPETCLLVTDFFLDHKVQLEDIPLLFGIIGRHTASPGLAWARYLSVCNGQKVKSFHLERLRCLKSIKNASIEGGDSTVLLPSIINHWGKLGIDSDDLSEWMQLVTIEMNDYFTNHQFDKIIERFQSLKRHCSKHSNFVANLKTYFRDLYFLHQEGKKIPTELFYLLWDNYPEVGEFWDIMRSIALNDGELERFWDLTAKYDSLIFFDREPVDLESLRVEIIKTEKWLHIFEQSMIGERSKFAPSSYKGLYRLVNKSIVDISKSFPHREIIAKVTKWGLLPKRVWLMLQNAAGELRQARDTLTEAKLLFLDNFVMGIWSLVHNNPLKLRPATINRLEVMGAVIWILSARLSNGDPDYHQLMKRFDPIAAKYRDVIEMAIKGHPKTGIYHKSLIETQGIFNFQRIFLWLYMNPHNLYYLMMIFFNLYVFYWFTKTEHNNKRI